MSDAALAAAIGGPVVGLAGVLFGWLTAREQREHGERLARGQQEHERTLARDARLHDQVREAYEELLVLVYVVEDIISRTNPVIGPAPDPPAMPPESELRRVSARISVVGSEEVVDGVAALWAAQRHFWATSQTLDMLRAQRADPGEAWERVEEARTAFRDRRRELEATVRAEVRA